MERRFTAVEFQSHTRFITQPAANSPAGFFIPDGGPAKPTSMTTLQTSQRNPPATLVAAAFGAVYLIWGSTYLAIRVAVETLPPFLLAGVRFTIAGLVLLALVRLAGTKMPTLKHWRNAGISGILMLVGGNGLVVLAEREVPSALTSLIIATTPVWFAILDWLRPGGKRPILREWFGIILGLGGVFLLVSDRFESKTPEISVHGIVILLIATICWAGGSLASKHTDKPASPWMSSAIQMVTGGVTMLGIAVLRGEHHLRLEAVSQASVLAVGYLIVFGSWVGFSSYVWLLKVSTAARVSTYAYVNPLIAVLLGWIVLGEKLSSSALGAAGVLLIGIVLLVWPRRAVQ
jgi:drug/metabolite transporter (DMT)-like permease